MFKIFIYENIFNIQLLLTSLVLGFLFILFNKLYKPFSYELSKSINSSFYLIGGLILIMSQLYSIIDIYLSRLDLFIYLTPYGQQISLETYSILFYILFLNIIFLFFKNNKLFVINFDKYVITKFYLIFIIIITYILILSIILESTDLFFIILCLEAQTMLTYCVISLFEKTTFYIFKNFFSLLVISTLSSLLIWFGVILILNLQNLYLLTSIFNSYTLNFLNYLTFFLILGFLQKLGVTPFHFWLKAAYSKLPIFSLAFLNINQKFLYFLLFCIITQQYFNSNIILSQLLYFFGFLTFFFGTLVTMYQRQLKDFLIVSSLTHIGLLLILYSYIYCFKTGSIINPLYSKLLMIYHPSLINETCKLMFWAYLFNYLFTMTIIWSIISSYEIILYNTVETERNMADLKNLIYQPLKSFLLVACMFSLGGIPPFVGFLFKFNLLLCFFKLNMNIFNLTLILIFSLFSIYYYLRISYEIYLNTNSKFTIRSLVLNTKNKLFILFSFFYLFFGPLFYKTIIYFIIITNLVSIF